MGMGEVADPEECAKIASLGVDFLAAGVDAIKATVREKIELFGSANKA